MNIIIWIWLKIIRSNTFDIDGKMEIGRSLSKIVSSPLFNIGIIFATFNLDGNIPVSRYLRLLPLALIYYRC